MAVTPKTPETPGFFSRMSSKLKSGAATTGEKVKKAAASVKTGAENLGKDIKHEALVAGQELKKVPGNFTMHPSEMNLPKTAGLAAAIAAGMGAVAYRKELAKGAKVLKGKIEKGAKRLKEKVKEEFKKD